MKILFLDIDGVINSIDNIYSRLQLWKISSHEYKSRDEFGDLFDERCVRWLTYIIQKTNCKIVISSTWRRLGLDKMQLMWEMRDLPGEVIDITPLSVSSRIVDMHFSTNSEADRGYEIQEWIENNNPEAYCIIDDDDDMLPIQLKCFVQTDSGLGITYKTAQRVIQILNNNLS